MVISRLGGDIYRIMLRARQGLLFFGMVEDWITLDLAGWGRKKPQGSGAPLEIDEDLTFRSHQERDPLLAKLPEESLAGMFKEVNKN
jgi:hypothetical protein